jgi:hypothetical protein
VEFFVPASAATFECANEIARSLSRIFAPRFPSDRTSRPHPCASLAFTFITLGRTCTH